MTSKADTAMNTKKSDFENWLDENAPAEWYDKCIELEAENNRLKLIISALTIPDETGYIEDVGFVNDFSELTDEGRKILEYYNLVQQAKALENLAESMLFRGHLENVLHRDEVEEKASQLRKQAEGE